MRVILLHNPKAGDRQWTSSRLQELFAEHGHECLCVSTKKSMWEKQLQQRAQAVVVAGGDGSVGQVALRLAQRKLPFCVLPVGTANNVAAALGCNQPPEKILAGLARARRRALDLGTAESFRGTQRFLESAGAGLVTAMMQHFPKKGYTRDAAKRLKQTRKRLISLLDDFEACECEVVMDGRKTSGKFLVVEAMNTERIGPKLLLAPNANPGDGWLDVVCISGRERSKLREYLIALLSHEHAPSPFEARRCRRVELWCSEPLLHVDGECCDFHTVEISLERSALKVLEPGRPAAAD